MERCHGTRRIDVRLEGEHLPRQVGGGGVRDGVVRVNDVEAMSGEILRLLRRDEERQALGDNARAIVRDRYDWRRLAARLVQIDERAARVRAVQEATT